MAPDINFGFGLSKSSRINLDNADNEKFRELAAREPDILKCMACGSCTASCSAGNFTELNLRKVILMLTRGAEKETVRQLESCMFCGKCILVCPRGINTRHLIKSIREIYCRPCAKPETSNGI